MECPNCETDISEDIIEVLDSGDVLECEECCAELEYTVTYDSDGVEIAKLSIVDVGAEANSDEEIIDEEEEE